MSDISTAVSPSNLTSPSPSNLTSPSFQMSGGMWFYVVSGLIDYALGIPANSWSLFVIVSSGGQRRSLVESEIITLNLVTMEIGSFLILILDSINFLFIKSMSMLTWVRFPLGLALSSRSLFQSLICVERYLAVVHPLVFLRYKPLRYRLACCGLIWVFALGYGCTYALLIFFKADLSILLLVLFLPLLSIDFFCSLSILRVLRQPGPGDRGREGNKDRRKEEQEQTAGAGEGGNVREGERAVERGKERVKEEGKNQQKRRAFRIVSFMMGMLVVNYVPLITCTTLKAKFELLVWRTQVMPVVISFSQMGSCIQALLYLHRSGRLLCLTPATRRCQQNN